MVCWSPNDRYLLASASDNHVTQIESSDGRANLVYASGIFILELARRLIMLTVP